MYFHKYEFTPLEIFLLLALLALALFVIVDDMVFAQRRRLRSAVPLPVSFMTRAAQVGFFVLLLRLLVLLIRASALDFSFALVATAAFCGLIWLIDRFVLLPQRR